MFRNESNLGIFCDRRTSNDCCQGTHEGRLAMTVKQNSFLSKCKQGKIQNFQDAKVMSLNLNIFDLILVRLLSKLKGKQNGSSFWSGTYCMAPVPVKVKICQNLPERFTILTKNELNFRHPVHSSTNFVSEI